MSEVGGPRRRQTVLHAEWTKFRTVRGWVIGDDRGGAGHRGARAGPQHDGLVRQERPASGCAGPLGPGGEPVTDSFYFVHRPLTGNGDITVRVTSLTGQIPTISGTRMRSGVMPWAKAGIIIKASTRQGSAYAAMMVTGGNGVRMQYDYTGDIAGPARLGVRGVAALAAAHPLRRHAHRLRLGRRHALDAGRHRHAWPGCPPTVQGGLFATSPQYAQTSVRQVERVSGASRATGVFDHVEPARRLGRRRVGRHGDRGARRPGGRLARRLPPGRGRVHRDRDRRHRARR